jgi:uncharacterized protein YqgV (UPF0045/DUF77 family)
MELPQSLINQINSGNVVLFLGAGASYGAIHSQKKKIPLGQELSDLIATKFLGENFKGQPLQYVSELAINETSLHEVQKYLYDYLIEFEPNPFHNIISQFKWKAIVTTNYDLLIEKVYNNTSSTFQNLVPFIKDGERIEDKMNGENSLIYLKLHGCLTNINDDSTPLILSPDQYVTHKTNRTRLFERFRDLSFEQPILFVGYGLADHDIRATLGHLESLGEGRPMSYMVGPNINDVESRVWGRKKITTIKTTFENFLNVIDKNTDKELRKLAGLYQLDPSLPIKQKFTNTNYSPTQSLQTFLDHEFTYIHENIKDEPTNPKDFYKGYFPNWFPIIENYDITRTIKDPIISEIFLIEEDERRSNQDVYVIKGAAGSGKTVLIKRLAWEAAVHFQKLCLYQKSDSRIRFEPIEELYNLTNERIFLFIDSPSESIEEIRYLIKLANKAKIPLTLICAERINVWNVDCIELHSITTQDFTLKYLDDNEIVKLINKLKEHKSLGYLEGKPLEDQKSSLSELYGRELLVALHEATMGKPFEDIIFNEYESIKDDDAKSMYLSISILHRLGAQTRAGLISRTNKITFTDFETRLFKPLESIVFSKRNYHINDYVYLTRHQYIAEIIFERVLTKISERHEQYMRILNCLDVDYESDRHAFISMINARKLLQIFKDPVLIREIYNLANQRDPNNAKLLQQEAIFEMLSDGGSITEAEELLVEATHLAPNDTFLSHSLAELYLRKAENSEKELIREKYFKQAKLICNNIIKKDKSGYAYHTLIKINLAQLSYLEEDRYDERIPAIIKETEKLLNQAKIDASNESMLLELEAKFNEILSETPKALKALEKAFNLNSKSTYIALRLYSFHKKNGSIEDAEKILKLCLESNPNDRDLNFNYGYQISTHQDPNWNDVKHYLRKSFTSGDTRYEAQFWYARCLYILKEYDAAKDIFSNLKDARVNINLKKDPRGSIREHGYVKVFYGSVTKIESSFGFLKEDYSGQSIFIYKFNEKENIWNNLKKYDRVKFLISFNYRGAVGSSIEKA